MMMKCCLASAATMALIMATVPAMAYTGQELSKQAKVSMAEARAIALKAHPGKITDERPSQIVPSKSYLTVSRSPTPNPTTPGG